MKKSDKAVRHSAVLVLGIIILLIPYAFWYLLGEDSYMNIHDSLDSELVYIKKIIDENAVLSFEAQSSIEGVMNGLPRGLLRSGLNLTFFLFSLLSPAYAYITNHLLVHLIGYLGMFLVLKRFFIKNNTAIVLCIALCFGFLPYYHIQYGISISGQPLLLYAFLNILHKKQKWYDWVVIIAFPWYSFLIVTLPFIVPFLVAIGIWHYYKNNSFSKLYFLAIGILCLVNIGVEIQLINTTFFRPDITSHRIEWDKFAVSGRPIISNFFNTILTNLKETHYHSGIVQVKPILILLLIGFTFFKLKLGLKSIVILGSISIIILWVAFNPFFTYVLRDLEFFRTFNSQRFYFLLPFLWLTLLAIIVSRLYKASYVGKVISILFIGYTMYAIIDVNKEYTSNIRIFFGATIQTPSFKKFYAEDLFRDIKEYLGNEEVTNYNFIHVGIYPNIGQYNGFKTLDSYQNNYQLSYKHEFKRIIAEELDKNEKNRNYFEYWGSRCYVFSSELGRKYLFPKTTNTKIKNLTLNTKQFKQMKGKYLISSVPILNYQTINFKFLKAFESPTSYWKLHLYQLQ